MLHKLSKIIYPLVLLVIISSCEGATNRNYTISNKSSHAVTAKGTTLNSDFEFSIAPHEKEMILNFEQRGGTEIAGHPSDYIFDLIISNPEDTCFKDYLEPSNWYLISEELDRIPSNWKHSFYFEFDNEDF